jgi:transposase InsO family protein
MGRKKQVGAPRSGAGGEGSGSAGATSGRAPAGRRHTPEERRAAVEAFHKSGLTQQAFARGWGVSQVTIGAWVRKHAAQGPQGLERVSTSPVKRRGRAPLAAPVREEVVAVQRRFPDFGLKKIRHFLARFAGLSVSTSSVRRVRQAEGLPAVAVAVRKKRKPAPPRRFERSKPGDLWQTDITYLNVPWQRTPLYLIAYLDDHSRFVVGHGLFTHQRGEIAVDTFLEACRAVGKPRECLSDQGRQYFAWRGKTEFQKMLAREGVVHVVARAHHPMTLGKVERLWETLKRELWDRIHPKDLEEARDRIKHFLAHHNFQRPHQSLDGLVPADRFFGVASEVRAAMTAAIAKNELRLALGETPRRPVYLVGQIDGKAVSLHGEAGRLVVQTPDGERQEIEAKDLGAFPGRKEVDDERSRQEQQQPQHEQPGADAAPARTPGDGADAGDAASPAAARGAEADDVRGAQADAQAGAGAVGGSDGGGPADGPQAGERGPADVAGQGDT